MIFVCVGSREYQFDRLLKKIDELIENGEIKESVFAQIGHSTYIPRSFKYQRFISVDEFKRYQFEADIIISHGGTGALINAIKMEKPLISVPRLERFGEHIDDHQVQVSTVLDNQGFLKCVINIEDLLDAIKTVKNLNISSISHRFNESSRIINIVRDFISYN